MQPKGFVACVKRIANQKFPQICVNSGYASSLLARIRVKRFKLVLCNFQIFCSDTINILYIPPPSAGEYTTFSLYTVLGRKNFYVLIPIEAIRELINKRFKSKHFCESHHYA
jgi:hypothetical protein